MYARRHAMDGTRPDPAALRRDLEQSLERCLFVLRSSSGGVALVRALVNLARSVAAFGGERFALLFLDETSTRIIRSPGDRYCHHSKRYRTGKKPLRRDECTICLPPQERLPGTGGYGTME